MSAFLNYLTMYMEANLCRKDKSMKEKEEPELYVPDSSAFLTFLPARSVI